MIVVMGATGKVGKEIVTHVLAAGEDVLALGRDAGKLSELADAGARTLAGDAADPAYLRAAVHGAEAVVTLLPYDPFLRGYQESQRRLSAAIVQAVRDASVPYLVFLSSVGADQPAGTGFISSLHAHEERLRRLEGTRILVLRAGAFFENFYGALEQIRHAGIIADTVTPNLRNPMIATRDIAATAAAALLARDWEGFVIRELLGQRDLSYAEATAIIGERIGNAQLSYVRVPDEVMVPELVGAGFAEDAAYLHIELNRAINAGMVRSSEGRCGANTTPTRFEDFATDLAHVVLAA